MNIQVHTVELSRSSLTMRFGTVVSRDGSRLGRVESWSTFRADGWQTRHYVTDCRGDIDPRHFGHLADAVEAVVTSARIGVR